MDDKHIIDVIRLLRKSHFYPEQQQAKEKPIMETQTLNLFGRSSASTKSAAPSPTILKSAVKTAHQTAGAVLGQAKETSDQVLADTVAVQKAVVSLLPDPLGLFKPGSTSASPVNTDQAQQSSPLSALEACSVPDQAKQSSPVNSTLFAVNSAPSALKGALSTAASSATSVLDQAKQGPPLAPTSLATSVLDQAKQGSPLGALATAVGSATFSAPTVLGQVKPASGLGSLENALGSATSSATNVLGQVKQDTHLGALGSAVNIGAISSPLSVLNKIKESSPLGALESAVSNATSSATSVLDQVKQGSPLGALETAVGSATSSATSVLGQAKQASGLGSLENALGSATSSATNVVGQMKQASGLATLENTLDNATKSVLDHVKEGSSHLAGGGTGLFKTGLGALNNTINIIAGPGLEAGKSLKFMMQMQVTMAKVMQYLITLYVHLKRYAGPFKPLLDAVEDAVKPIARYINPVSISIWMQKLMLYILHTIADVKKVGFVETAKSQFARYEPQAEKWAMAAWKVFLKLPFTVTFVHITGPIVLFLAEEVNDLIEFLKKMKLPFVNYLILLPVEKFETFIKLAK